MGFGDLKTPAGLKALNAYLEDKSFIDGYVPSQADVVVFNALTGAPGAEFYHALRWYNQVKSYSSTFDSLPGVKKPLDQYGSAGAAPAGGDDEDSDSDGDLFGDDDDDAEELAKVKAKAAANKPKKTVIAKSNVILDVKPWEDTTPMKAIEDHVRAIKMDGLLWGASKLVPLAYGIKKLQISCVVEDAKVSIDDIEEQITGLEEHVQSVDIAAFNKI